MERRALPVGGISPQRTSWLAVASGIIGIAAVLLLIAAVTTRTTWINSNQVDLLFRAHDLGVVLQFLLLIPFVLGLQELSRRTPPSLSKGTILWGIGAISFVALLLTLGITKIVNDMFYMLPQGIFGAWLIVVNTRVSGLLPRELRYFGLVVGIGLVLVGTVFPGLAAFVYPNMLKIPAVSVDNDAFQNTGVNRLFHLILAVGSVLGVAALPIWTFLTGLKLLSKE